ncbi:MAG: sulfurtransferase [Halobacteriaceae archaeon]
MSDDEVGPGDGFPVTRRALLSAAAGTAVTAGAGCAEITTPADVADAGLSYANMEHVVDAAWTAEHRGDVAVLDARPRSAFRTERIYGARCPRFDGERSLTTRRETDRGLVPDADAIAAALGDAGLRPDDDVVVYGASVGARVTRLVFALDYVGHRGSVSVMTGGFESWPGRVGTGDRQPDPADYAPDPNPDRVVTRSWLADHLTAVADDGPALIDVRAPAAYLADAGSPELVAENDRHGHVPGAVNVHWIGNLGGRRLKPADELATLYFASQADVAQDETVVVYSQDNVNATNTYLVLRSLGVSDVRVYEGGFGEWADAGDDCCPVETKTTAVVETEGEVSGGSSGSFSCTG